MLSKLILPLILIAIEVAFYLWNNTVFTFTLPIICIGLVSYIYFQNNPVEHKRDFRIRCWGNWIPLGMTYAFLYMGRYNLTVAKSYFPDDVMSKSDFGTIFGIGAVVYGVSFIINGPITDKIGGRTTMIIGAIGAAVANLAMGIVTYYAAIGKIDGKLLVPFIVLYGINMYFQSFGAVSIVKVNAAWFHIKERGVFGGIFGTLISLGIFLAFDLTGKIIELTKTADGPQIWWAFFVPAGVLVIWVIVDIFLVRDKPSDAGFKDFNTGDAGSDDDASSTKSESPIALYKKLLTHPVILIMIAIEFCSGVLRNGIMHWGKLFSKDVGIYNTDFFFQNWGLVLMVAGISGGFFGGFVSDKLFQSRRGPVGFFLYAGMFVGFVVMVAAVPLQWYFIVGFLSFFMSMCVIGVHGMLSGTASMDFGGKKGAATTAGIIDGFVYLGTGFQSITLGYIITEHGWNYWPIFLIPFTLIGLYFTRKIWNAFPDSKGKSGGH